jgi:hypothetical protein
LETCDLTVAIYTLNCDDRRPGILVSGRTFQRSAPAQGDRSSRSSRT